MKGRAVTWVSEPGLGTDCGLELSHLGTQKTVSCLESAPSFKWIGSVLGLLGLGTRVR